MWDYLRKQFTRSKPNDLDSRVAKSENLSPYQAINDVLSGMMGNFGNKESIYQLYGSNEICRLGVDKLANDLSSLDYKIDGDESADTDKLLDIVNSREYKNMMNECWKDYILDGNMIQTKGVGSLTKQMYFRRIIVKNNMVKANYVDGQVVSIELALDVKETTDRNGMSDKLFIFGNRDPRDSKLHYLSPISAVAEELRRVKCARDWNNTLLERGGIAPVLLSLGVDGNMDGAQLKENLKMLEKAQKNNKGSPIGIVPIENMEVHVIGTTAKEMDFIEGQKQSINYILLGMGIPPEVLGLNEVQAANATKLDAIQGYYNSTIIPIAERYAGMVSLWLNYYPKTAVSAEDRANGKRATRPIKDKINLMVDKASVPYAQDIQAKRMNDLEAITFLTDNEKRVMFGLEELEEMNFVADNTNNNTAENGNE